MKFNEADQEIFDKILQDFINELGEEQSLKIIRDVHSLHKKIAKKLGKKNMPIAYIYRTLLSEKMNTSIDEGGYKGMKLEDIAEKENVPLRIIRDVYEKTCNSTGDNL